MSCSKGVRNLLRLQREGEISHETPQQKRASSRVEGRISWFLSSCGSKLGSLPKYDGDLRDRLMGALG